MQLHVLHKCSISVTVTEANLAYYLPFLVKKCKLLIIVPPFPNGHLM